MHSWLVVGQSVAMYETKVPSFDESKLPVPYQLETGLSVQNINISE